VTLGVIREEEEEEEAKKEEEVAAGKLEKLNTSNTKDRV
jgi:hypothetical protein